MVTQQFILRDAALAQKINSSQLQLESREDVRRRERQEHLRKQRTDLLHTGRYLKQFSEVSVLGRGGFGTVMKV